MEDNSEKTESTDSTSKGRSYSNFGLRMYPGRVEKTELNWFENIVSQTFDNKFYRKRCEYNVAKAIKTHPILKILVGALKSAGCPLDLKRHIVCEDCSRKVQGGYDCDYNQIVVCQNSAKTRDNPVTILIHELIHMYDNCVNEVNFKNLEHVACTEIRAANLAHCSFLTTMYMGHSSFFNIKKTHQYCVKTQAAKSLETAFNLDSITAIRYILKVFDKCYNDLEPIGRRVRRKSAEGIMAEEEAKCFLITDTED